MKIKIIFIIFCLVVSVVYAQENLVPQKINFTEFVGDIPNPDRGFYTPGTGGTVPGSGGTQGGGSRAGLTRISGTNTDVEVRWTYYIGLDIRFREMLLHNLPLNYVKKQKESHSSF